MPFRSQFASNEEYNAYFRAYRQKNRLKMREYNRKYNSLWRKVHGYHNEEKWHNEHPDRVKAQRQLRYAVKTGKVKKYWCEVCHSLKSVAHHDDYSQPLKVRWLCHEHDRIAHYRGGSSDSSSSSPST